MDCDKLLGGWLGGSCTPDPGGRGRGREQRRGRRLRVAPAALRAAGVLVPVPGQAPPGVWGAGAPQEGQSPKSLSRSMLVAIFQTVLLPDLMAAIHTKAGQQLQATAMGRNLIWENWPSWGVRSLQTPRTGASSAKKGPQHGVSAAEGRRPAPLGAGGARSSGSGGRDNFPIYVKPCSGGPFLTSSITSN